MQPKLYLAGPEVFLPNAAECAQMQRELCRRYDFVPLHPLDTDVDPDRKDVMAKNIYEANIAKIRECDVVIANGNSFRGACMDDGTAYELGYGNALGKPSYGYIRELIPLVERTMREYQCHPFKNGHLDKDGYLIEDFDMSRNLMMECGMQFRNGRLIEGDFEVCLRAIRSDLDSGRLAL